MMIGKEVLSKHNKKIIELIEQLPEYRKQERIRQLYESLMDRIEPLKKENVKQYNIKKELFTKQYFRAEKILLNKIMEKNENCWPKIEEEVE